MFSIIAKFFGGIPTLYLLIGGVVLLGAALYYADDFGYTRAENKAAAARLKEVLVAQELFNKEVARGNALAEELAKKEVKIVYETVEKLKYVYQNTTNRPCLSSDVVRVLNNPVNPDKTVTPREPASEDATPVASDTDVAAWAADAQGRYTTCATRYNALIDYVRPQSQPAVE